MLRRILLLTALVAGTIIPATAAEAATPTVALTFQPARVSANTTLHLAVKSANLPTGTVLYLQRQFGTDHIFKNVKQLTVRNGTTTAPAVAMGRYVYRIRAMRNTTVVARSANRTLYSYGNISVTQLCNRSVYTYCAYTETGTIPVGSNVFSYQATGHSYNTGPDGDWAISAQQRSSCRSATIRFATSNWDTDVNSTGVALMQTTADMATASGTPGTVGSVTFHISSPAWNMVMYTDTGDALMYFAGTLSCWSASGDR